MNGVFINQFHHGPSKVVTMINGSDDLEFVKTWVNNEEGLRRQEGGDEGGGRKDKQNLGPQLLTYQVVMKGVAPGAATKDATQPNHLVVPVSGGPGVDPSYHGYHFTRAMMKQIDEDAVHFYEIALAHFRDGFRTCLRRFGPPTRPDFTFSPIVN